MANFRDQNSAVCVTIVLLIYAVKIKVCVFYGNVNIMHQASLHSVYHNYKIII